MTIKHWVSALALVVLGWFSLQLLVMRFTDAAPGAVVLFPASDFAARLPGGVAIVGAGSAWVSVKSDAEGLGKTLYRAGALLVLPAGLPGCLPLSS